MKGIVMNLLAEMVETQLGIDEWNQVLDAADESASSLQRQFMKMQDCCNSSVF